jgi:hypothetical protein
MEARWRKRVSAKAGVLTAVTLLLFGGLCVGLCAGATTLTLPPSSSAARSCPFQSDIWGPNYRYDR